MKMIKIDGKEFAEGSQEACDAMSAYAKRLDAHHKDLTTAEDERRDAARKHQTDMKKMSDDLEAAKAKTDALEEKTKKSEQEKKDAAAQAVQDFKARQDLEQSARIVLGKKEKLDGVSDKDIKLKVLKSAEPELKLDGKTDAYVDARYDIAIEAAREDAEDNTTRGGVTAARQIVTDTEDDLEPGDPRNDDMSDEEANKPHADSDSAYRAMMYRNRTAWRQPLAPNSKDLEARTR